MERFEKARAGKSFKLKAERAIRNAPEVLRDEDVIQARIERQKQLKLDILNTKQLNDVADLKRKAVKLDARHDPSNSRRNPHDEVRALQIRIALYEKVLRHVAKGHRSSRGMASLVLEGKWLNSPGNWMHREYGL